MIAVGGAVYRTHDEGYVLVRHGEDHTWRVDDAHFLDRAEELRTGRHPELAGMPADLDAGPLLPATLDAILSQDYPGGIEVIVADGSEKTAAAELLRTCYPQVLRVGNPDGKISAGLNRALAASRHPVVQRCDAHAVLAPGYISRAVEILERIDAVNVGGRMNPVGTTPFERAVALATAGGFDETLLVNEDYEMNWRLREAGGIVWFAPDLVADYRPRGGFVALAQQYFGYGSWKRVMLRRHPRSLRARQLVPVLLLLALAASALLAASGFPTLAALAPGAWAAALIGASAVAGFRRREPAAALMPAVLATIHLAWAIGFFCPTGTARSGNSTQSAAPDTGTAR